jgi:hypothetical protein
MPAAVSLRNAGDRLGDPDPSPMPRTLFCLDLGQPTADGGIFGGVFKNHIYNNLNINNIF